MQKVDRDWLAANDAHPHVLHLADVINDAVRRLDELLSAIGKQADEFLDPHLVQATDEATTTDGEVEATDPSGDA